MEWQRQLCEPEYACNHVTNCRAKCLLACSRRDCMRCCKSGENVYSRAKLFLVRGTINKCFCLHVVVRTAKFVARKQWVVCGADDMFIRVYNYNTMDKVKAFEAHTDYIRYAIQGHRGIPSQISDLRFKRAEVFLYSLVANVSAVAARVS
jgi:hypothetical protein